jgi:hypothetical protein
MTRVVTASALTAALAAPVPVIAQQASRRTDVWRDIQGFNIVLILGESERSENSSLELPGAARRALADMREFLPYKHYRVLDSQWMSCCAPESVRIGLPMAGRLQGVVETSKIRATTAGNRRDVLDPRPYAFTLMLMSGDGSRLPVKFALRLDEPASGGRGGGSAQAAESARRVADMRSDLEIMSVQIAELQKRVDAGVTRPEELRVLQGRHAQLQRRIAAAEDGATTHSSSSHRPIIDTSFTMDVGETVVVGTSRLGGDKALIALVTAVRRSGGGR